jgi:CubicO group peptidase (beta-lactamase class C family)
MMLFRAGAALVFLLSLLAGAQATLPPIRVPERAIDSLVRQRMATARIPGMAVAVVYDGKTVFERAWGVSNVETETPMTLASVFELASVTKQITAAAVMLLVEQGKVRLDEPIAAYVAEAPANWSAVTVRHLLTHTSGINGPSVPSFEGSPLLRITTKQAFDAAVALRPLFSPGANALYSDEGYFLLGMIIERASGQRYGEFLQQRIFTPLGMSGASLLDKRRVLKGRVATYEIQRDTLVNWRRDWQHELPAFFGVFATVADVVKWDESLRRGTLLSRASLDQMWTPASLANGRPALVTSRPYGFGFELMDIRGRRYAAHSGASGAYVLHFFDEPLSIVVLGNLANTAGPNSTLMAREIAGVLRAEYLPPHRVRATNDPAPATTDSVRALLVAMGGGTASSLMTSHHRAWFEATPTSFRASWFRRLASIDKLTYLTCDDMRGRGVRMLDEIDRICHYRIETGAQPLFVTSWFDSAGRVSFVRFGRADEL